MSLKYQGILTNSHPGFYSRYSGLLDHDHAILLGSWLNDDIASRDIAFNEGFFVERDTSCGNNGAVQFPLDQGAVRVDRVLTFELTIDRHVKVAASNFAEDFGGLKEYDVAGALDGTSENSFDDEIVALDHHALH